MKVHVVSPHGYCSGVWRALKIASSTKSEHPNEPIYMLGALVHNEITVDSLKEQGFSILDEMDGPLEEQLKTLENGSLIVFSAHGHPKSFDEIAKSKKLRVIDATCPFVDENRLVGLSVSSPLFYLGARGHLEAISFLSNCPHAIFLDAKKPETDQTGRRCSLICQTTLSDEEIENALTFLHSRFEKVDLLRSRCDATSARQAAVRSIPKEIEAVIVLGSQTSNNTKKLAEIARQEGFATIMALNVQELKTMDLSGYSSVALCSGASTPPEVFASCLAYLEELGAR